LGGSAGRWLFGATGAGASLVAGGVLSPAVVGAPAEGSSFDPVWQAARTAARAIAVVVARNTRPAVFDM
jgi:hypothetical protein